MDALLSLDVSPETFVTFSIMSSPNRPTHLMSGDRAYVKLTRNRQDKRTFYALEFAVTRGEKLLSFMIDGKLAQSASIRLWDGDRLPTDEVLFRSMGTLLACQILAMMAAVGELSAIEMTKEDQPNKPALVHCGFAKTPNRLRRSSPP